MAALITSVECSVKAKRWPLELLMKVLLKGQTVALITSVESSVKDNRWPLELPMKVLLERPSRSLDHI